MADTGRNCVRRLTAATTAHVAGGGGTTTCAATTATAVSLSGPLSVAVDASDNVYIADTGRNCVRKVVGTTVSVTAGGGATTACTAVTTSTAVSLSAPQGVAVDAAGTVYVADTGRRCVRQVVGTAVTQVGFTGTNSSRRRQRPGVGGHHPHPLDAERPLRRRPRRLRPGHQFRVQPAPPPRAVMTPTVATPPGLDALRGHRPVARHPSVGTSVPSP